MAAARPALLLLALVFVAGLAVQGLTLLRLREEVADAARFERAGTAAAATQLVLAHQQLHAALLDHRLGMPELGVRQAYEGFAQRLEQMRAALSAPGLDRLPGVAAAVQQASALAGRVDARMGALGAEQLPQPAIEALARGVPALREPLDQMQQAVLARQALAEAELEARLRGIAARGQAALLLLGAIALLALMAALLALRRMRRAGLMQARLAMRAQELRGEAEQAVRGRLDALAFVAAETNARITGVTGGLARALDERELDPRLREALLGLRTQTDDLLVLATDLADLARLEAGELRLRPAPFLLADAMQQAADLLRHRFRTEAVSVVVAAPGELPAWWRGDAARVRQLLHQLGSAAVELRTHGTVTLSATRLTPDTDATSASRHDGEAADGPAKDRPGHGGSLKAATEQAERLVLRAAIAPGGAALPASANAAPPRSLSLSLVRTLSAAMGGRLEQQEEPGGGCTLSVVLPLGSCAAPASVAMPEVGAPATGPLEVLVVDDVVLNRRLLGAVLERFGHNCEMATDGLDALRAVQQRRFDVVLMDIQMPNLDGLAATRMLRALPPPAGLVPVIAVTAAGEPEDRAAYAAAGMDGFVQKPVATDDLMAAIAAAVGARRREPAAERDSPAELAVGPLMDAQTLAILRSTLAAEEMTRLAAATEAEATAALRAAETAAAAGNAPALAAAAVTLMQACEGVGALRVLAIARAVQAAAIEGSAARAAAHLPALRRALGETLGAISRRAGAEPGRIPALAIETPALANPALANPALADPALADPALEPVPGRQAS